MSIRIASATAKIGFVFAQRGVVMEACSSFFMPRLIGFSRALLVSATSSASQNNKYSLYLKVHDDYGICHICNVTNHTGPLC